MKKLIVLSLCLSSVPALAYDVTIKCRDFNGVETVAMKYAAPKAWKESTSTLSHYYLADKDAFAPVAADFQSLRVEYQMHEEDRLVSVRSADVLIGTEFTEYSQGSETLIDLKLQLGQDSVRFKGFYSIEGNQIFYRMNGMGFEHGGYFHGEINGEPMICALDTEGNI